jgi:hypothetical protein
MSFLILKTTFDFVIDNGQIPRCRGLVVYDQA